MLWRALAFQALQSSVRELIAKGGVNDSGAQTPWGSSWTHNDETDGDIYDMVITLGMI